jgi:hypothetical protein
LLCSPLVSVTGAILNVWVWLRSKVVKIAVTEAFKGPKRARRGMVRNVCDHTLGKAALMKVQEIAGLTNRVTGKSRESHVRRRARSVARETCSQPHDSLSLTLRRPFGESCSKQLTLDSALTQAS